MSLPRNEVPPFEPADDTAGAAGAVTDRTELRARARPAVVPLSFAQERLWFLDQLDPGSTAWNVHMAWRMRGELDEAALHRAVSEVVRRHESLRTRFPAEGGTARQLVDPPSPVPLPRVDLRNVPASDAEAEARRLAEDEVRRPFDLAAGPLLRASLFRLGADHHVVLVVMHHILTDGWSWAVFLRELSETYRAVTAGEPVSLPDLPVQYADYAVWQRAWLTEERLEAQLDYWRRQLAGLRPLRLPFDRPRPKRPTFHGGTRPLALGTDLSERVQALARHEKVTPYMFILAAVQVLLARYSGQDDVAVGSPIAGRTRPELEGLIGFFINALVLRGDLSADPTVRELLAQTRDTALAAYAHQDLPFERLVAELEPTRDLARHPLFQVLVGFRVAAGDEPELPGLELTSFDLPQATRRFDLELQFYKGSDGLVGEVIYATDLFDVETVDRLATHLEQLLRAMVASPDDRVSQLQFLSGEELRRLDDSNDTAMPYASEQCVHELFEAQVARTPAATAVVAGAEKRSFRDLDDAADRLALRLRAMGVGREVVVGVCLERSVELVVSLLAVLKSGGVYLPLDPRYPSERLAFMLRTSRARLVLTTEQLLSRLGDLTVPALYVDVSEDACPDRSARPARCSTYPDNLAAVVYTSGSTGRPKGVAIPHRQLTNRLAWVWQRYPFSDDDVACARSKTSFLPSLPELLGPLCAGTTTVLTTEEQASDPEQLVQVLAAHRITRIVLVPSLLAALLDADLDLETKLGDLRLCSLGGEPLAADLVQRMQARLPTVTVVNQYGASELNDVLTYEAPSELSQSDGRVPVGRPIANTRAYVLDRRLNRVAIGVAGELFIGGVGLARGYLHQPALTAQRFVPDPFAADGSRLYRTGDLARYRPDGHIEHLGRTDFQLKIRGFRIEPAEVEDALRAQPEIRDVVVTSHADHRREPRLVAYVVARDAALPPGPELRARLRRRLPDYMIPVAFVALDSLPRTPAGKVDRVALPAPDFAGAGGARDAADPRGTTEQLVAATWADLLGVEHVGVDANFFDLGGDSLMATRMVSRLRSQGLDITLQEFFEHQTVAEVAHVARPAKAADALPAPDQRTMVAADTSDTIEAPTTYEQRKSAELDERGLPRFNVVDAAYQLIGRVDTHAIEEAVNLIVQRHESLRTAFMGGAEELRQVIYPSLHVSVPVLDLRTMPLRERLSEVDRLILSQRNTRFDLTQPPLVRASILRVDDAEYVLLVAMHHIVSDAWSRNIFLAEMAAVYRQLMAGGDPSTAVADLPIQYRDHVTAALHDLDVNAQRKLDFWKRELRDLPERLELAGARSRDSINDYSRGAHQFSLPADDLERLLALGRHRQATLFMMLMAAYTTVLAQRSGTRDIVVSTMLAGRDRSEYEPLIGLFAQPTSIRTRLDEAETFVELVDHVRAVALRVFDNQGLPLAQFASELGLGDDPWRLPVWDIWFTFHPRMLEQTDLLRPDVLPDITVDQIDVYEREHYEEPARWGGDNLTLLVAEKPDQLFCVLEYNERLFDAGTIADMAHAFEHVVARVARDPQISLSALLSPTTDEDSHR